MSSWVKKQLRAVLGVLLRLWFIAEHVVYYLVNVIFFTRRKVPPIDADLLRCSASKLIRLMKNKDVTCEEVVSTYISRIRQVQPILNAVVQENFDAALKKARQIDDRIRIGVIDESAWIEQPLLGIPFTLKDCIAVEDFIMTAGIIYRKNCRMTKDADVVRNLKNAGAIHLAVTNVSEVCMWWESNNAVYGRTSNPYDTRCIVGGSSGGEGALIASGGSLIGIGSDIGGSLRMPAFFNGIFTLKPSPDILSDEGNYPVPHGYQIKMHTNGPMCRYATDLELMLRAMASKQAIEMLQLEKKVDISKLRIFYIESFESLVCQPVSADQRHALFNVLRYMEGRYSTPCLRLSLPLLKWIMPIYMNDLADTPTNHQVTFAQEMGNKEIEVNCNAELLKLLVGRSQHTLPAIALALMEKYDRRLQNPQVHQYITMQREKLQRQINALLDENTVLLLPTHPSVAPYHTQALAQPFNFLYTGLVNSLGLPCTQIPMGLSGSKHDHLPTGIQVVAGCNLDRLCLAMARELESAFGGWQEP